MTYPAAQSQRPMVPNPPRLARAFLTRIWFSRLDDDLLHFASRINLLVPLLLGSNSHCPPLSLALRIKILLLHLEFVVWLGTLFAGPTDLTDLQRQASICYVQQVGEARRDPGDPVQQVESRSMPEAPDTMI